MDYSAACGDAAVFVRAHGREAPCRRGQFRRTHFPRHLRLRQRDQPRHADVWIVLDRHALCVCQCQSRSRGCSGPSWRLCSRKLQRRHLLPAGACCERTAHGNKASNKNAHAAGINLFFPDSVMSIPPRPRSWFFPPVDHQVNGRNEEHGDDYGERQSADDGPRQRRILLATRLQTQRHRYHA